MVECFTTFLLSVSARILVGLGKRDTQSVLHPFDLRRWNLGVEMIERLPIRLRLIETPLDRSADIFRNLRGHDVRRVEVFLEVQGALRGQWRWAGLATDTAQYQKTGQHLREGARVDFYDQVLQAGHGCSWG
jgi:hypothetical protein